MSGEAVGKTIGSARSVAVPIVGSGIGAGARSSLRHAANTITLTRTIGINHPTHRFRFKLDTS